MPQAITDKLVEKKAITRVNLKINWQLVASLGLLVLLPLLFLWRVTFNGDVLLSADMLLTYEPWRSESPGGGAVPIWNERTADPLLDSYALAEFIKTSWRQGRLPLWYPHVGLGLPILGRSIGQAFYPINNILWQSMDGADAFGWSTILHLILAGFFTFFYVRELKVGYAGSLMAAIAFSYSSHLTIWLGLPFTFNPMVWIPLIFLGFERAMNRGEWRWALLGIAAVALQILSGTLQLVSYSLLSLGLYALARAAIIWWQQREVRRTIHPLALAGLIIGLGCGLVAFQILSTLELVQTGITRSNLEGGGTLPVRALARLIVPDIWGNPVDGTNMSSLEFEGYLYLGILPLFFAVAALFSDRAAVAGILFGIGLLYVLVIIGLPPFYQIFAYIYPAFESLGFYRSSYAITFLWAAAAGIGFDWLLAHRPARLLKGLLWGGSAIGLVVLLFTLRLAFVSKYEARHFWQLPPPPEMQPSLTYHFTVLILSLIFLGASLWLLWRWAAAQLSPQFFAGAAITLLIVELFLVHLDYTPALPKTMLDLSPPSLTYLQDLVQKEKNPGRVLGVENMLPPDTGRLYGISSVQIHDSFLSQRFSDYADLTHLRGGGHFRDITFQPATNPLLDALNVTYIYAPRAVLPQGDWFSILQNMGQPQVDSQHPEAGQVQHWNINGWTQPVLFAPGNTVLTYPGRLPFPAVLDTAIAVAPQANAPTPVTFEVYVTSPDQTPGEPIFSQRLNPASSDNWQPIAVDLSAYAQQDVMISLVTRSDDATVVPGGWANPLLTDGSKYERIYYGVNSIYKNKKALPRAWIVHRVSQAASIDEAKQRLAAPDFDSAAEAVIEGELAEVVQNSEVSEQPEFVEVRPTHIKLNADMAAPGLLVLSDLYYPGWNVYVDGARQPLYAANLIMRGVYVPAGSHMVEFIYEPVSLRVGLYISLGTAIALLILLGWTWSFKRGQS